MSWTSFATGCTKLELAQYLKGGRLYVNESMESETEIWCAAYSDWSITGKIWQRSRRTASSVSCLLPPKRVSGSIVTGAISVEKGASISGNVQIRTITEVKA